MAMTFTFIKKSGRGNGEMVGENDGICSDGQTDFLDKRKDNIYIDCILETPYRLLV